METPATFKGSEPKKPRIYGKAGNCKIHKTTKLIEDDHDCCGCCCSDCDPEFTCPKCQALYEKKHAIWFRKFGHIVATGSRLEVKNGRLITMSSDLRYMQFLHGGKPLKIGSWCKVGEDGFLKRSTKNNYPQMLVLS